VTLSASLPTIQGNCFDGVTAILFVVAMSEYDLMLYEDQTVRRMEESMKLFDEMCNSQIFIQTPLVLFLNKSDLFREKIKHVDLSVCFPEYKGGPDFERACAFTKAKFEALNKQPQTKAIYPHVTCATDTENVQFVFNAVKDTLLTAALDDAGL
jgi:guanine nucleotide-binding protein G(i) subunit alpha